jgi:hypothetical protein
MRRLLRLGSRSPRKVPGSTLSSHPLSCAGTAGAAWANAVHGGCVFGGRIDLTIGTLPDPTPTVPASRLGLWKRPGH